MPAGQQTWPQTVTLRCQALLHPHEGAQPGCLVFHNGRVVSTRPGDVQGEVVEAPDAIVIPGLVNAHTHLEFSDLASPLGRPGISLPEWIPLVVSHRRSQSPNGDSPSSPASEDALRGAALRKGFAESVAAGVTQVGDIATSPWDAGWIDQKHRPGAAFLELLSLDSGAVHSIMQQAREHLAERQGWARGLSPHATYSVHPELLDAACRLSSQTKTHVAMHVAETREELQLLATGSGPFQEMLDAFRVWRPDVFAASRQPLDFLQVLSQAEHALVVHGNYLTARDLEFLGQQRHNMTLVYCPRTHQFFGHEPYPLSEAIAAGATLALGTDSRASNPDLNLWQDFQFAVEQHSHVDPAHLLAAATVNGRRALGDAWQGWEGSSHNELTLVEPGASPPTTNEHRRVWDQLLGSTARPLADLVRC